MSQGEECSPKSSMPLIVDSGATTPAAPVVAHLNIGRMRGSEMFARLVNLNPHLDIQMLGDNSFRAMARVLPTPVIEVVHETPIPYPNRAARRAAMKRKF